MRIKDLIQELSRFSPDAVVGVEVVHTETMLGGKQLASHRETENIERLKYNAGAGRIEVVIVAENTY